MSKQVTMADVARAAGVSLQTVSRAINNKEDINSATRKHVLAIVDELGYHPSGIARSLATQRTTTIGLLVPDIANPFFSEIVRGVEDTAYANAYNVFLCNADEDIQREEAALSSLLEKRVDGLILCSSRLEMDALLGWLEQFRYVVLFNRVNESSRRVPGVHAIYVDDARATRRAIAYLAGCGRKRIAILAGPEKSWSSANRLSAYRDEMQRRGFHVPDGYVRYCSPDLKGGAEVMQGLLRENEDVDAILAFNDLVAVGACQACRQAGVRIPEDVAIIGSDDIPLASYMHPALTTLRSPQRQIGAEAMKTLMALFRHENIPDDPCVFEPELVVRESTPCQGR